MKIFAVALFVGLVAVASAEQECYTAATNFCSVNDKNNLLEYQKKCSALFKHFDKAKNGLQDLAVQQLEVSYEYLLMATQFNGYITNRPGFASHFKSLSDRSWKAGMDIIKFITRRGGKFEFPITGNKTISSNNLNEVQAMSMVLDSEKKLYEKAREVRKDISHAAGHTNDQKSMYDPEAAHMVDEELLKPLVSSIRKFSGFANDLKNLYETSKDRNLDNYLFDQYLQKA